MEDRDLIFKKVHLASLIKLLLNLYERNVDFVDILRSYDEDGECAIGLMFSNDYIKDESKPSEKKDTKITDEDINNII